VASLTVVAYKDWVEVVSNPSEGLVEEFRDCAHANSVFRGYHRQDMLELVFPEEDVAFRICWLGGCSRLACCWSRSRVETYSKLTLNGSLLKVVELRSEDVVVLIQARQKPVGTARWSDDAGWLRVVV
jgi:hypothetical protein